MRGNSNKVGWITTNEFGLSSTDPTGYKDMDTQFSMRRFKNIKDAYMLCTKDFTGVG